MHNSTHSGKKLSHWLSKTIIGLDDVFVVKPLFLVQITNQIAILQKKKSWYQCSTEYESDISEGSDSEFEIYRAR